MSLFLVDVHVSIIFCNLFLSSSMLFGESVLTYNVIKFESILLVLFSYNLVSSLFMFFSIIYYGKLLLIKLSLILLISLSKSVHVEQVLYAR